jgi:hypothetical protein
MWLIFAIFFNVTFYFPIIYIYIYIYIYLSLVVYFYYHNSWEHVLWQVMLSQHQHNEALCKAFISPHRFVQNEPTQVWWFNIILFKSNSSFFTYWISHYENQKIHILHCNWPLHKPSYYFGQTTSYFFFNVYLYISRQF